ncbi:UBP-type zinc finger domain-containing protein [Actinokineospora auranticolor]|uniref:Ubiquitin-hydrolase Zn-finger-containing protein n=1 Tax=Actinokineospora auranticolor TaxID=155976 RepID=A0A2S6GRY5_9PSEU|nr:UBP-type zinc finger domain-containing protein [Actinokineospora auranticolor]PPK67891.1 ubiquitin-hydrolase Zn-finger-containing protein [Actinokineospora auranticolor]
MACEHTETLPADVRDDAADECAECVAAGNRHWVHLRLCLTCGHVGCCDSSPGKHASGHYRETDHPVMRSYEPGETWRWCFVDDRIV